MWKNASFALIALFWVTMNAMLWHSEMGPGHEFASTVPAALVWEKILTAPDDSSLSITINGKKTGFLKWRPSAGEEASNGQVINENEPEGMVRKLTEYRVEIEGSFMAEILARAVRFTTDLRVNPELKWKSFAARTSFRPTVWQVKGNAENREIWIQAEEDGAEWIRRFTFDELRDPRKLLADLESPIIGALLSHGSVFQNANTSLGLDWTARYEWLQIGRNRVRIYRLTARLLGAYEVSVMVSRVGEILKAEFPGNLKLVNETLFAN